MKTKIILLFMVILTSLKGFAQIEPLYTMYRYNPLVISPAFAGYDSTKSITAMSRMQWLGIDGAPTTFGVTGNFAFKQKQGLGFNILQDKVGPMKSTTVGFDYGYHVKLAKNLRLSGGIRAGFTNYNVNLSGLRLITVDDPNFGQSITTGLQPNLGWGISLNTDKFFLSISEPRVFRNNFNKYDKSAKYRDYGHFYGMIGIKKRIGKNIELKPTIMLRMMKNAPLSWDVNALATIKERLDVGLTYRHEDSFGIQLGYLVSKKLYLGYIFEYPTSNIKAATNQTHELALKFLFGKN